MRLLLAFSLVSILSACASRPTVPALYGHWDADESDKLAGGTLNMALEITPTTVTVKNTCLLPSGRKLVATVTSEAEITQRAIKLLDAKNAETEEAHPLEAKEKKGLGVRETCTATTKPGRIHYYIESGKLHLDTPGPGPAKLFTKATPAALK